MSGEVVPYENEIIFYTTPEGGVHVEVIYSEESFWLSQRKMADLFGVEVNTINYHLKEIFASGELKEGPTVRKFRIVQPEGGRQVSRDVEFYHLDAIIAVGYRVNSRQATQFRIWATATLREFMIKGFVLDMEECPAREDSEIRCEGSQKLSGAARDKRVGTHCLDVPGLCRKPGCQTYSHEDDGLGAKARCLFEVQRISDTGQRRNSLP